MTSNQSDASGQPTQEAPSPPGTPLREDAPDGGIAPDAEREELAPGGSDGSAADDRPTGDLPPITHDEPEQSTGEAVRQEENAETTEDEPSQ